MHGTPENRMKQHTRRPLLGAFNMALMSLLLAGTAATAAEPAAPAAVKTAAQKPATSAAQQAHKTFRNEMAFCASGQSVQGRQVCEQEARAAHAQSLRSTLSAGSSQTYSENARQRCQALPAAERSGCMMRVDGKAAPGEVLVVPGSEAPLQATTPPRP
jgi:hypothetical protein